MRAACTALLILSTALLHTQEPRFEIASIKPNQSGARGAMGLFLFPGGRVVAQNVPLRDLIRAAWTLEDSQIDGGPAWVNTDRFDVEARTGDNATADDVRAMARALFTERFHLVTHTEARPMGIYALVTARPDRRLGKAMHPAGAECAPVTAPAGVPAPPPPPPGSGLGLGGLPFRCPSGFLPGSLSLRSIDLPGFAIVLWRRAAIGRPVVDHTGLTGTFDIDLSYAPEGERVNGGLLPTDGLPSIFTALQEQLGLRLDSTRGPIDVLVIDRVEPPSEN